MTQSDGQASLSALLLINSSVQGLGTFAQKCHSRYISTFYTTIACILLSRKKDIFHYVGFVIIQMHNSFSWFVEKFKFFDKFYLSLNQSSNLSIQCLNQVVPVALAVFTFTRKTELIYDRQRHAYWEALSRKRVACCIKFSSFCQLNGKDAVRENEPPPPSPPPLN